MIPTEDNYADWLSCAAGRYLRRRGWSFFSVSIGQVREAGFPVDKLFLVGNKIVGIQLKRPLNPPANRTGYEYGYSQRQHNEMLNAARSSIFYALPHSVDYRDQHRMHRSVRFYEAHEVEPLTASKMRPYQDAGLNFFEFVKGIKACPIGQKIPAGFTFSTFLALAQRFPTFAFLVINLEGKTAFMIRIKKTQLGEPLSD